MGRRREFINHCFGIVLNGCFAFAFYQVVFAKTVVECAFAWFNTPCRRKEYAIPLIVAILVTVLYIKLSFGKPFHIFRVAMVDK